MLLRSLDNRIAAFLLAFLILAPSLLYPFGSDQSIFAYMGRAWADGAVLYRDVWDNKPPAAYLCFGALYRISKFFGADNIAIWMFAVRVFDVTMAALTSMLLCVLARRWMNPIAGLSTAAGLAAAAWYAALYMHCSFWGMAQAESWANPFIVAAVLLCVVVGQEDNAPRLRIWFCIGLLTGIAAVFKFTTALPVFPAIAWLFWKTWNQAEKPARLFRALVSFLCVTIGIILPLALTVFWLVGSGAWPAYLDVQIGFVKPYTQVNSGDAGLRIASILVFTYLWLLRLGVPAALAIAGCCNRAVRQRHSKILSLAVLLFAICAVWAQGKFFRYHWITVLPFAAFFAAVGSVWLCAVIRLPHRITALVNIGLVLLWTACIHWPDHRDFALWTSGNLSAQSWLARFDWAKQGGGSFLSSQELARFVRLHSQPDDEIQVWGIETLVYHLSNRRASTRYFFNTPLAARFAPPRWKDDFLAQLERNKPRLFIVQRDDHSFPITGRTDDSASQLQDWPQLRDWLATHYSRTKTIGKYQVYERKIG